MATINEIGAQKCKNCRFWEPCESVAETGSCHRFRPEPEKKKEQGEWKYREIYKDSNEWWVGNSLGKFRPLGQCFSMVGFGGIEFEEWPDEWFMSFHFVDLDGDPDSQAYTSEKHCRPATPKRVRFWVGEK